MQSSTILVVSFFPFYPSFFASNRFSSFLSFFFLQIQFQFQHLFFGNTVQENTRRDNVSIHFCAASMRNVVHVWILSSSLGIHYRSILLLTDIFSNKYSILYRPDVIHFT